MDETIPNTTSISATNTGSDGPRPSFWGYVLLLLALAGVRVFEVATSGSYLRVYAYESDLAWIVASTLAVFVCFFVTTILRARYPIAISILMSVVVGATTTLVASTIPGMVVGLMVGAVATFKVSRQLVFLTLSALWFVGVPAALVGLLTGFASATSVLRATAPLAIFWKAMGALSFLSIAAVAWTYFLGRRDRKRRGPTPITDLFAFSAFFVIVTVAFVTGIQIDNFRRERASGVSCWSYARVPLGYRSLVQGFMQPASLLIQGGLNDQQGRWLRPFCEVTDINLRAPWDAQGEATDVTGLRNVDLRSVASVASANWLVSGMTDEGLSEFCNSPHVYSILLPVSQITDAGLTSLTRMPSLSQLDLSGSRVDGTGFRHLHPQAPLEKLFLAGSPVNDIIFDNLSDHPVVYLDVAGSQITGDGLKRSNLSKLFRLNVSNSKFDERNVPFIPSSVSDLDLSGTRITKLGTRALAKRKGLKFLTLINTHIQDDAIEELRNLSITELKIDATDLSTRSAAALSNVGRIELVFRAEDKPIVELIEHCQAMKEAVYRARGLSNLSDGSTFAGSDVKITIDGLSVRYSMLDELRKLDCQLTSPVVLPRHGDTPLKAYSMNPKEEHLRHLNAVRARPLEVHDIDAIYAREQRVWEHEQLIESQ